MTETAKPQAASVAVECLGITGKQGFALSPVGFEPTYVEFEPGRPTQMAQHYADYIVAQDPQRFRLAGKAAKNEGTGGDDKAGDKKPNFAERMKAAKAAKKTP